MKKITSTTKSEATKVIGLDLSDREGTYVGLDQAGTVVEKDKVTLTKVGLEKAFWGRGQLLIAIEAGSHSPWVSRALAEMGHEVIVANPRELALIYRSKRKSDHLDATTLARLARSDRELLHPIHHRGQEAQQDLAVLRARDGIVACRTKLINLVRGMVKADGERLPRCDADSFHLKAAPFIPERLRPALDETVEQIAHMTAGIERYDKKLEALQREKYPEALIVQQPNGVGPVTSLAFVLTLEDPKRFASSRDVPAYLGLTPARKQSGDRDPEMHITRAGDAFLRRLLVQSAHYILGPFGKDCDLRRWGQRLAGAPEGRGSKQRKKRAVIAVARKLAVLLHVLWRRNATYEPLRQAKWREVAA
jgi:transposase